MWTTAEDAQRYQELTHTLHVLLEEDAALRGEQRVAPEELALYVEWLELAREALDSPPPFAARSSPYTLSTLCYRELESDFRWLGSRITRALETGEGLEELEELPAFGTV